MDPRKKRILVVVDPTATSQPALERAAWLGRSIPATLELFICDYSSQLLEQESLDAAALAEARKSFVANHRRRLKDLARPLAAAGLEVGVDARWDTPLHEGIVRKAAEWGADVVVKDTHYHSTLRRSIFTNTDWHLIRECPGDLLLVKPRAVAQKPCILAAVDPLHANDKPAALDHKILAAAVELNARLGGELHAFHAFDITPILAASADALTMPIALPVQELTDMMRTEHTRAVQALAKAHDIPADRVHVHQGDTLHLLTALTEQLRADIVVMGAIARTGLRRIFIGSTAEQVLDRLSCDLWIVKPGDAIAAPSV
jgi:universal stress protein E